MSKVKNILAVFVIASFQYYQQCHGQQSIEDILYDRTARGLESWIFLRVPPQTYSDRRDLLWTASRLTDNIRRGKFPINEGYKIEKPSIPFTREDEGFESKSSSRPNSGRPAVKPADPTPTAPTTSRPAQRKPGDLILNRENPNPCEWKIAEMPNFNVPGRRVSEIKCEEYKYRTSYIDAVYAKNYSCNMYKAELQTGAPTYAVIGGRDTSLDEFPHMGALGWRGVDGDWKFQCGASLISEKFLLTAAHCSKASSSDTSLANTSPEIVRLGIPNLKTWDETDKPYDAEIAQIIVHPQYSSPRQYFDIALVEMKKELKFDFIRPACLWTQNDLRPLGDRALVTGWGYVDAAVTIMAANLQVADVDIIDLFLCEELLRPHWNRNFNGLRSHQICAGVLTGGVDTCRGDSGGPLQVKIRTANRMNYIIGVTSFGRGCARKNSPGIYTRVSSFVDWIESKVWQN